MKLQKKIEDALKSAGLPETFWDKLKIGEEADIAGAVDALKALTQQEPSREQVKSGLTRLVAEGDDEIKSWLSGLVQPVSEAGQTKEPQSSQSPGENDERPDGGSSPEKLLENSEFVKQVIDGIQQNVINGILKDGSLPVVSQGVDPDMSSDIRSFAREKNEISTSAGFKSSSLGL